jgi:hypothetical protein
MYLRILNTLLFLFLFGSVRSQVEVTIILQKQSDSTAISFAALSSSVTGKTSITDNDGSIVLTYTSLPVNDTLTVSMLGFHGKVPVHISTNRKVVFINAASASLAPVVVSGFTPLSVIREAIRRIPDNYADSSFFCHSFMRQYQNINGKYRNLIESRPVVAFNISGDQAGLTSLESFYMKALRRTDIRCDIKDLCTWSLSDVLAQDPVYHRNSGALTTVALDRYYFTFEEERDSSTYRIFYSCPVSYENHGLHNFTPTAFAGESRESGIIEIDKTSFAIKRYQRRAIRNKGYNYPKANNFVRPSLQYTIEFVDAELIVEYKKTAERWAASSIYHRYTNEFFRTQSYEKQFTITDYAFWVAEEFSKEVPSETIEKFYFDIDPGYIPYTYKPQDWRTLPEIRSDEWIRAKAAFDLNRNLQTEMERSK